MIKKHLLLSVENGSYFCVKCDSYCLERWNEAVAVFFSTDFSPRRSTTTWPSRSQSSTMEVTSLKSGFVVVCSVLVWTVLFLSLFISDLSLCAKGFCFWVLWVSVVLVFMFYRWYHRGYLLWPALSVMEEFLKHMYSLEEDYLLVMRLFLVFRVLFSLWIQYFKMISQTLQMNSVEAHMGKHAKIRQSQIKL